MGTGEIGMRRGIGACNSGLALSEVAWAGDASGGAVHAWQVQQASIASPNLRYEFWLWSLLNTVCKSDALNATQAICHDLKARGVWGTTAVFTQVACASAHTHMTLLHPPAHPSWRWSDM